MNKFLKILILPIAIITMLVGFAGTAFATESPLNVQFVPNPLFEKNNFLPEDTAEGIATVTNNSVSTQTILTESINGFDADGLGNHLNLTIVGSDSTTYFDGSLGSFLTIGEVSLGTLNNGDSRAYTFTVSFANINDNNYQGKSLGFDICVGFEGSDLSCGNTTVGDHGGGDGGGGGGTIIPGSGGGGPISTSLTIFNEQAIDISNVGQSGSATIVWNTNLLSTSQVVYGLASGGPYTLDLALSNFGYPFGTTEELTKVSYHSVAITGLTPGETYVYRVVSRASPPTVSFEHTFEVPTLAQGGSISFIGGNPSTNTSGSGASSVSNTSSGASSFGTVSSGETPEGSASPTNTEEDNTNPNNNLASVFASGFGNILSICTLVALLILLVFYIIWRVWFRKKYEKQGIPEKEIWNRFYLFFGSSSLLAVLTFMVFREYCLLPVFTVVFVVSLCLYLFRKF